MRHDYQDYLLREEGFEKVNMEVVVRVFGKK